MLKTIAALALALSALTGAACNSAKASDAGELINGRCRCDGDTMCVQQVSAAGARPVACVSKVSSMGCGQFASATRSCWPSSKVSGLCLCNGGDSLAAAR